MVIVVDNSVILPLFLPDEDSEAAEEILCQVGEGIDLVVPGFWILEFGNALLVCSRRERITPEQLARAQRMASRLPLTITAFPTTADIEAVHTLARSHELSFYDASYLALAIHREGSLATKDARLAKAASSEGVLHHSGGSTRE